MIDTPIIDAQIIDESQSSSNQATNNQPAAPGTFDINAYNATLEVVRRRLSIIESSKIELKKLKEMHDDAFLGNELYVKADKLVKEATQKRKEIQAQLSKQSAVAEVFDKMKNLKEQIRDEESTLADELMEYYKTAGVLEIEDADGNVQEFIFTVRLKPKIKIA